jgi:hypothetical protein
MEMVGSKIIGADQHWELLPAQAAMSVKVGSIVHGFQAFPSFPAVRLLFDHPCTQLVIIPPHFMIISGWDEIAPPEKVDDW